jgi:hypothetical protein
MILEHYSKNKKILLFIFLLLVIIGLIFSFKTYFYKDENKETVFCSQDAKLCPDGSYVGRSGPNCEFNSCPIDYEEELSGFNNEHIEKSIINYLLTQKDFSWKTEENSHSFCAVKNFDPDNELFPFYIWSYCGEYAIRDGELVNISGSSMPVKIDYPNELSFYNLNQFSFEKPGDGSSYTEDIKRIFPEEIQQEVFDFDPKKIIKRLEKEAFDKILAWQSIEKAINECEVKSVFQAHSKEVSADLKNGEKIFAVEPNIDDIIDLAVEAEENCGKIIMATE